MFVKMKHIETDEPSVYLPYHNFLDRLYKLRDMYQVHVCTVPVCCLPCCLVFPCHPLPAFLMIPCLPLCVTLSLCVPAGVRARVSVEVCASRVHGREGSMLQQPHPVVARRVSRVLGLPPVRLSHQRDDAHHGLQGVFWIAQCVLFSGILMHLIVVVSSFGWLCSTAVRWAR